MSVRIYHNPRCSKSRQALQLLEQRSVVPHIIDYLNTPPDAATLCELLDMLSVEPRELMRKGEQEYRESGADNPELSRDQLIALMVKYPRLIERPIVVSNGKAVIGRPPERILEIL